MIVCVVPDLDHSRHHCVRHPILERQYTESTVSESHLGPDLDRTQAVLVDLMVLMYSKQAAVEGVHGELIDVCSEVKGLFRWQCRNNVLVR